MNRRIDSHKLMLHPDTVCKWKNGDQIYPLYVEISPTSLCNYKCSFCALDFMKRGDSLGYDTAMSAIHQMADLGVKSIMFAGEGEPLRWLNNQNVYNFINLVQYAKAVGIDTALTTNGSLLDDNMSFHLLPIMSWIKVSLSSAVPTTFANMSGFDRRSGMGMLGKVIQNIWQAVELRNEFKHKCDIGIQMLVTEENENDIETTIILARELGVDYIVLKQYSHHPASLNDHKTPAMVDWTWMSTSKFQVIQRDPIIGHAYDKCYALPFWSYISSNGDVFACSSHIPDPMFLLGNIYKDKLVDIWHKRNYDLLQEKVDINQCRTNCRMNKCNEYLSEIINPNRHVNFI